MKRNPASLATRLALLSIALGLWSAAPLLSALAAPGDLDLTFGGGTGKVASPSGYGRAVAIQPDGKLVVAGIVGFGSDFQVARYLPNGDPDPAFNTTGSVVTPVGTGTEQVDSVLIQPDGKILVGGAARLGASPFNFAVVRYLANGALDPDFNGSGIFLNNLGVFSSEVHGMALQSDGKILLAGYANDSSVDLVVARLTAGGTLDSTFNTTGFVILPIGTGEDRGHDVAVQADGKILVTGFTRNGSFDDMVLARFDSGGALDPTFNSTGLLTQRFFGGQDNLGIRVNVQPDGKILVEGTYSTSPGSPGGRISFLRYLPDGTLDPAFGIGGVANTLFLTDTQFPTTDFVLQSNGKIVFNHNGAFQVSRLTASGQMDTTFNGTGTVAVSFSGGGIVRGVGVQSDGKIVFAGHAGPTFTPTFAVARVEGDPVAPSSNILYRKGDAVPGAGIDPRIPAGAIYNTLYSPAINDSGQVAYRAKWKAGRVSGYGVFVGGTLVSAVGDEPPGFPGDPIKSLGDPQINSEGEVAFLASMVSKARAVFTDQGGSLALAVQNGAPAPGLAGAELGSVRSFLLTDTALHWQTILKSGPGGVSRANDAVLYRWSPGSGNELALREGQSVGPLGTLKSFKTLKASAPGGAQGRYAGPGDGVLVVASFTDKSKGVISVVPGAVTEIVHSGTAVPGDPAGATFNSFGLPFGADGDWVGGLAKLKSGVGGVTSADATVILAGEPGSDYLNLVARQGDFATDEAGAPLGGVQFKGFKEPVFSPEGDAAFLASLKGTVTKIDDSGIWSRPDGAMTPLLLAREGGAVAEADPVETWAKFTALAQPGGSTGPLIGGALTGATVTRANDAGLWGVDSAGDLRLLLREGATVDGKTVKTIHVLKVVAGSLGVTRSFNDHGEVVALVGFTNGSSAIVRVVVP